MTDLYPVLKQLHVACVGLSFGAFFIRGLWRFSGRMLPQSGWVHWAPHINDTILLSAGVSLAVTTSQYPLANSWLTAKLIGLVAYIALGWMALRKDIDPTARLAAWSAALAAFAYVVSVALAKNPLGFLILALRPNGA